MVFNESVHLPQVRGTLLDDYLARGWYRMQDTIFTTSHLFKEKVFNFQRVLWLRYQVADLEDRGSLRRIRGKNNGFTVTLIDHLQITQEQEELFSRYRDSVDFSLYESLKEALGSEDGQGPFDTKAFEIRHLGRLIACGIFDAGAESGASIIHFFDPQYKAYSLGKYLILLTVDWCRLTGRTLFYPGYLIAGDPKLNYKLFLGVPGAWCYVPWEVTDPEHRPTTELWKPFSPEMLVPPEYPRHTWAEDFKIFFK